MNREGEVIIEEPRAYDNRSNGDIERAIKSVQGQVRKIKDACDARPSHRLRPESHMFVAASIFRRWVDGVQKSARKSV